MSVRKYYPGTSCITNSNSFNEVNYVLSRQHSLPVFQANQCHRILFPVYPQVRLGGYMVRSPPIFYPTIVSQAVNIHAFAIVFNVEPTSFYLYCIILQRLSFGKVHIGPETIVSESSVMANYRGKHAPIELYRPPSKVFFICLLK